MRILWLKTELLHPVDKGGKIRTYNMLKELKRDHFISYMSLDDGSADSAAREQAYEYCHELICVPYEQREKFSSGFYAELLLNLASRFPYAIKKYESPSMRGQISERVNSGTFDVVPIPAGASVATHGDEPEDFDEHSIHMPDPSYMPLIAALGLPLIAVGLLYSYAIVAVGALVLVVGLYGWVYEPASSSE